MNILHITSTDLRGAGSAVTAINTLLNANGHHSRMVVVFKTKDDATITGMLPTLPKTMRNRMDAAILCFGKIQSRLTIGKAHPDYFFYNLDERKSNFTAKQILKKIAFKPDAIFVHWASRFVNTKEIRNLAELTAAQMFWVMIDNAPITGGCHYPYDCKGYETDCGNCPALLSDSKKHIAQRNFALKKANMPAGLHILTFSSMDKLRAEKSSMYANQTADVIFLPVNEQIFRPALTSDARRYFNLPEDRKIIFFAATDPNERRKGYAELCEALKYIFMSNENTDEYMFATAGKNPPKSGWGGG